MPQRIKHRDGDLLLLLDVGDILDQVLFGDGDITSSGQCRYNT